jgi:3-hydroxyisobutyrate dehydrogenase
MDRNATEKPVGFIGLGTMGEPMAMRLVRSGVELLVWNRSPEKCHTLAEAGAAVATEPAVIFQQCHTIISMLVDGDALDAVLSRKREAFGTNVRGRTLVNMATTAPSYSRELERDVRAAGGRYVEAPVSGSRKPAEAGELVGLLAGEPEDLDIVRTLIAPLTRESIVCGPVPNALLMKLSVNLFMTAIVTGLAEAVHFAERHGLDLSQFVAAVNGGPLASDVSAVKAKKLVEQDFAVQASITNVLENVRLISRTAREADIASPLLDACHNLFEETKALGLGEADMIAVIRAIEQRSLGAA